MPEQLRTCQRCGAEFYSWQPAASHCSGACRQAIYRRRKSNAVTQAFGLAYSGLENVNAMRMIDIDAVADRLGCSASSVRNLARSDAGFPQPRRIGKLLRWVDAEVDQWIGGRGESVEHRPLPACETRVI